MFEIIKANKGALIVRISNDLHSCFVSYPEGSKWLCGGVANQYYLIPY